MKGIKGSTKRRNDVRDNIKSIISDYLEGKTAQRIADEYKITKSVILKLLKLNNVSMRKPAPLKGRIPWNKGKRCSQNGGENHWCWKGGVTPLNMRIRRCGKYRQWVKDIFERDNYTCQLCNKRGGELEADHYPKRFAVIITENKIDSFDKAMDSKELWDYNNARTLCINCHNKTKTSFNVKSNKLVKQKSMV